MISKENFGKFIGQRRKYKGVSQQELAAKVCVDYKTLSKWENGSCFPDIESMECLSKALDFYITDVINERLDMTCYESKETKQFRLITNISFLVVTVLIAIFKIIFCYSVQFKNTILEIFIFATLFIVFFIVINKPYLLYRKKFGFVIKLLSFLLICALLIF